MPDAFDTLTRRAPLVATFRAWCLYRSEAVFRQDGKLRALRNLLAELDALR